MFFIELLSDPVYLCDCEASVNPWTAEKPFSSFKAASWTSCHFHSELFFFLFNGEFLSIKKQ